MARYKLRVPDAGTMLYGDGQAMVADTLDEARELWEDYTGEFHVCMHSYIGRCRIVYARDVEQGECHEDAEPGDTTLDYLADDGRALLDSEVRVWEPGVVVPWVGTERMDPVGDAATMPVGVKVKHDEYGWGHTISKPSRIFSGWWHAVDFDGLYAGAEPDGPAGGIGGHPRLIAHDRLTFFQTDGWPATLWRVRVDGEFVAEGIESERMAYSLGQVRVDRITAELEAAMEADYERGRVSC